MSIDDKSTAVVLVADDNPQNLQVASSMLTECGWQVRVAIDGEAALKSIELKAPDLILLDIHMPKLNGYEVCKALKENPQTRHIPIIFATAVSEGFNKSTCFEMGAVDYITKPMLLEELRSRIGVHLELAHANKLIEQKNAEIAKLRAC
ncbi:response regulator [Vibrio sp. JC009]|uniref:response regulator n=1 Tax=Vibrio sp. JC009 TaxID=2912314 RepID=UPI0023AF80EE|nr:response regulator [Vibrio sp. JC009]WED20793.1 response regulator [Vibrio sp. JC009]